MRLLRALPPSLCLLLLAGCLGPDLFEPVDMPHTKQANLVIDDIRDDIHNFGYSCAEIKKTEQCQYPHGKLVRYSCGPGRDPAKIYPDEIYTMTDDNRIVGTLRHVTKGKSDHIYARWKDRSDECPADPFPATAPTSP